MLNDKLHEVIFIGLPGPTHHYGGLSGDNVASALNRGMLSNPKQAALQALELARLVNRLGPPAAILPPQLRPHLPMLREQFSGEDTSVIAQAAQHAPALLEQASSSSAMWTANAATVAPGIDCADGKLHITTANLFTHPHRRIEADATFRTLSAIFAAAPDCIIHPPLSASTGLRDEGAANHMRLSPGLSAAGLHVFVYGDATGARQNLTASQAIAAQHRLAERQCLFLAQNPDAIAQGVFHNDVVAVSNDHLLLAHEDAYRGGPDAIDQIAHAFAVLHPGKSLVPLVIRRDQLTLEEAVRSYLFNSQLITRPDGTMAIIAPVETQLLYQGKAAAILEALRDAPTNPIEEIHYADLRQSMRNGGGPACLRLRVPMTGAQLAAIRSHCRILADDALLDTLTQLVESHYPDALEAQGLGDPALLARSKSLQGAISDAMHIKSCITES